MFAPGNLYRFSLCNTGRSCIASPDMPDIDETTSYPLRQRSEDFGILRQCPENNGKRSNDLFTITERILAADSLIFIVNKYTDG